jgi:hypothetical protein
MLKYRYPVESGTPEEAGHAGHASPAAAQTRTPHHESFTVSGTGYHVEAAGGAYAMTEPGERRSRQARAPMAAPPTYHGRLSLLIYEARSPAAAGRAMIHHMATMHG